MKKAFFVIIIVSYNPGKRLFDTLESVKRQNFDDYRILIKDGLSTDGSIEKLKSEYELGGRIRLVEGCDNGIYHAMNIAISHVYECFEETKKLKAGESPSYVFFLNCGDVFSDENVLKNVHDSIVSRNRREGTTLPAIFYGDIYDSQTKTRVASNPQIDDFACYRNVPSHQACFYDERLIYKNPFDLKYKVRADYEQFLRCFYKEKAETCYIPIIIADYEGGGYSDQNRKISELERKEIIKMYLPASKIRKYDFIRVITLAGLRTFLANNKITAGVYNSLKEFAYSIKGSVKEK